jgi:hypothetical protein
VRQVWRFSRPGRSSSLSTLTLFLLSWVVLTQVSKPRDPYSRDLYDSYIGLGQTNCFINHFGYNVCQESVYFYAYPSGAVWLTLRNAGATNGDRFTGTRTPA